MSPSFLLFHAENVNEYRNSICHLILIPVIDGEKLPTIEFFLNPEASSFLFVQSGITEKQVKTFETFKSKWFDIQSIFANYPIAVSTADGYSAHSLAGTLMRLGIDFNPITYCNAKAICRRTMNEASYNFDYLNYVLYDDMISASEPIKVAERWCDIVLKALAQINGESLQNSLDLWKIKPGSISKNEFITSICEKIYAGKTRERLDVDSIDVNPLPDHPFYGMNVVFTGKLESMLRNDARTAVVRIGGNAPENLTQDTDYLVVGVQDLRVVGEKGLSGKMKKAAKYKEKGFPIEIIDEDDFIEMLGETRQ